MKCVDLSFAYMYLLFLCLIYCLCWLFSSVLFGNGHLMVVTTIALLFSVVVFVHEMQKEDTTRMLFSLNFLGNGARLGFHFGLARQCSEGVCGKCVQPGNKRVHIIKLDINLPES